jgi:hypothetical protein
VRRPAFLSADRLDHNDHDDWTVVAVTSTAATVVVCLAFWLVGGLNWLFFAFAAMTGALLLGTLYTLSGRSMEAAQDTRERVLERHYVGVAWYASMLRNATVRGGYERGMRGELTRLAAVRLAERRDVNLYRDPEAARRVIGPELWPLVDPRVTVRPGDDPPIVPMRAVVALVDLLEQL